MHNPSLVKPHSRLRTKGVLTYDPVPLAGRKSASTRSLIVTLPQDDLDLYYQWFITRAHGQALKIQRPLFGLHVTVVRNDERVPNMDAWGKHAGVEVSLEYDTVLRNHTVFWSLPVYNDDLQEIRAELGLPPERDFHITIGRQYEWQPVPAHAQFEAWELRKQREDQESNDVMLRGT